MGMGKNKRRNKAPLGIIRIPGLTRELAHRTGMTLAQSENIVREIFSIIKYYLFNRMNVEIPRFGIFQLTKLASKLFILPSGEKIWKKDRLHCRFKFSTRFKSELSKIDIKDMEKETRNDIDDIDDIIV